METSYDDATTLSSKESDFCSFENYDSMSSYEEPSIMKLLLRGMNSIKIYYFIYSIIVCSSIRFHLLPLNLNSLKILAS
jgi:hypothetical protein